MPKRFRLQMYIKKLRHCFSSHSAVFLPGVQRLWITVNTKLNGWIQLRLWLQNHIFLAYVRRFIFFLFYHFSVLYMYVTMDIIHFLTSLFLLLTFQLKNSIPYIVKGINNLLWIRWLYPNCFYGTRKETGTKIFMIFWL